MRDRMKEVWRQVKTNETNEKAKQMTEYMDFYRENTVDQIEWVEDPDLEIKFKAEAAIGSTLFNVQYDQLTRDNSTDGFYTEVNQSLSKMFRERPLQVSNLTEGGQGLAWLPQGENSPYLLDNDFEDYTHDIVIYRPKEENTGERNTMAIRKVEDFGFIPQDKPLNGLIKGLEDF
jgi:hypothetical protein